MHLDVENPLKKSQSRVIVFVLISFVHRGYTHKYLYFYLIATVLASNMAQPRPLLQPKNIEHSSEA